MVYASCKVIRLTTTFVQDGMAEDQSQDSGNKLGLKCCHPSLAARPRNVQAHGAMSRRVFVQQAGCALRMRDTMFKTVFEVPEVANEKSALL